VRLKNKTALITGAASGIGEGIAKLFAEEGAFVYIADLNEKAAQTASEKIKENGGRAEPLILDVTGEESWAKAVAKVVETRGKIDILVNNAGIVIRKALTEMPAEDFDTVMAVNVRGPFLGTKHVIPVMQKNGGGAIVNISSICGLIGHKFSNDAYITSKGAVTLLTKAVAVKYAKDNIRCNSVHPSTVDTAIVQDLFKDPVKKKERLDEVPLGRLATTRDIANAVLFLASEEASFITGVGLPVDGGLTAS
jgi:NAD(P)-dependent dehydrogenase (short-subunit alcohol dehydrogenase family)